MSRMQHPLVQTLIFLALVVAAAFGGHGKYWFP
jgi:hypothetical protein